MKDFIPASAGELERIDGDVYIVGGFVRDALLGKRTDDIDICSSCSTDEICRLFGDKADVINRRLGTVKIRLGNDTYEHTQFRREVYAHGGAHSPSRVILGASLNEDAMRRDFTVNALYYNLKTGELSDPTGRGLADLKAKVLSGILPETLTHDGLRILRMVRMCAEHGFCPSKELMSCAKKNAHLLRDIAPERIYAELKRILTAEHPCARLLAASRAIDVIFPELALGKRIGQNPQYHKYSVFTHCIMACENAVPVLEVRLAALLHDVAKPICLKEYGNMHGHDVLGAELAEKMLTRLKADAKTTMRVKTLIRWHMYDLKGDIPEKTVKKKIAELGEDAFVNLMQLRDADFAGSGKLSKKSASDRLRRIFAEMKAERAPMSPKDLAVSGRDVMRILNLPPCSRVGKIIDRLLTLCIESPELNTKEKLTEEIRKFR